VGIYILLTTAFWGETYDDVFLAYQYAKNIEAGNGFVFNVGEHFLGTPAPLFVMLLVGVHWALPHLTIPQVGTVISCFGLAVTAYALYALGCRFGQRLLGALIGLLAVFNPFSLLVLGGESPLYLALVTSSFLMLSRRRFALTGVLLGLALLCRTEALIPIAVVVGAYLLSERKIPLSLLAAVVCTALPWVAFACWEFGSPLTNSFIAKVAQVRSGRKPFPFGFARWFQIIVFGPHPLLLCSLLPATVGAWVLITRAAPFRLIAVWGFAQTAAYCVMPIPFYHWYAAHVGVLGAVLIGVGTWSLVRTFRETRGAVTLPKKVLVAATCVCTAVTAIVCTRIAYAYNERWPHAPANALYVQAGQWFKEHSAPNARIAYLEIGQIAFYADRYIIDTLGLVTPGAAKEVAKRNWLWPLKHYKPDYIIYNSLFTKWPESGVIFNEPWFTEGFKEEAQISTSLYPTPLVIYKRIPGAVVPD
jgi:hypothetical protein